MKKIILALMLVLCYINAIRAQFTTEQLEFRYKIFSFINNEDENFSPSIDKDGDISFSYAGWKWYYIMNETWKDPFMCTLYTSFSYKNYPKSEIVKCLPTILQIKGVNVRIYDDSYALEANIPTNDIKAIEVSFKILLDKMIEAKALLELCIDNDLAGVDFFSDKQTVFEKAISFYVKEEYQEAFALFKWLSENGFSDAFVMLGYMYQQGQGTECDELKMKECYLSGISKGDYSCAYFLADYYKSESNFVKAFEYFQKAASNDNVYRCDASYEMGCLYEQGKGETKSPDIEKAIISYKQSVRYADELKCDARLALLRLHETAETKEEFENASASVSLAGLSPDALYERGQDYELARKDVEYVSMPYAFAYYKESAKHKQVWACLKLANIYADDFYPVKDEKESESYYKKAISLLKKNNSAQAQYELGMIYLNGHAVEVDLAMAESYLKSSATSGNVQAAYQLGCIYRDATQHEKAYPYFLKAAEGNVGMAMYEVAYMFDNGLGTGRDSSKAAFWYRKCIEVGCEASDKAAEAMKRLESQGEKES